MIKGTYSSHIAIAAILFAVSITAFSASIAHAQKAGVFNNTIMETKKTTQNAVLLLDKVLNDAISDAIFANNCTENTELVKQRITSYFVQTQAEFQPKCLIKINSITEKTGIVAGQIVYLTDFSVTCSEGVNNDFNSVFVGKKVFQRHATETLSGNLCTVTVFDGTLQELLKTG